MSESEKPSQDKSTLSSTPDPEVIPEKVKKRKNLTVSYKLRILKEVENLKDTSGEIGALLRREGLYSSHISNWRRELKEGRLTERGSVKRGPQPSQSKYEREIIRLKKELAEAQLENEQSQKIIEAQKKIAEFLELSRQRVDLAKKPSNKD